MKLNLKTGLILPVILLLQGCPGNYGYKYHTGTFPDYPVNFTEINTEYDDYNASAPTLGETFPLLFSSTRNSGGADFDFIYKLISIRFDKTTGELSIAEEPLSHYDNVIQNDNLNDVVKKVNTSFDELGPYLIFRGSVSEENAYYYEYALLYSNNERGNQDILYTHNTNSEEYEDPLPVSFLNSAADDAYPCFNGNNSAIYFCSDRDQGFDIYRVQTDPEMEILEILASEDTLSIVKDTVLSSDGDDKCPYIAYNSFETEQEELVRNLLVFASNREGGYGGFDLYFSLLEDGEWSPPQNFGPGINTEYDEYRPIVRPQWDFTNDFMLFSSNRPGGLGGFDLYYVGIPDIGYPFNN